MSAKILFESSPKVYFWTFTWWDVHNDWDYPMMWNNFARKVKDMYPLACGVRVIEVSPGGHGLHYHLLVNRRLSIQLISRIAKRYGIGRIGVIRCDYGAAVYLSKYLAKDEFRLFGGIRRWSTFGSWRGVHKNDIEISSNYMRARNYVVGPNKVRIGEEFLLRGAYTLGGRERMAKCYEFLCNHQTDKACMLVAPNVELTAKGGLRYIRAKNYINYAVARRVKRKKLEVPF